MGRPHQFGARFGSMGGGGLPVANDLIALIAVLFVTFSFQFFDLTVLLVELLRLTSGVVRGFVWQLVSYPFIGFGQPSVWFLLELLILFWFSRDIFWRLGRRRFWSLLVWTSIGAGVVAALVHLIFVTGLGAFPVTTSFMLMQGQRILLTIIIAAFATLNGEATVLLFFVLPVKARWFLWLEILFAFITFLSIKDIAGLAGIVAAVAITYSSLTRGGLQRLIADTRLRLRRFIIERRLARLRGERKFDIIDGQGGKGDKGDKGEWLH